MPRDSLTLYIFCDILPRLPPKTKYFCLTKGQAQRFLNPLFPSQKILSFTASLLSCRFQCRQIFKLCHFECKFVTFSLWDSFNSCHSLEQFGKSISNHPFQFQCLQLVTISQQLSLITVFKYIISVQIKRSLEAIMRCQVIEPRVLQFHFAVW